MSRNKFYDKTISLLKERFSDNTALDILDNMQAVYEAKDSDYSATRSEEHTSELQSH